MIPVLMLFVIPVGGGIPAGVLLARSYALPWQTTSFLYFISDVLLALAFEPLMLLFIAAGRRVPFLARVGWAFKTATLQITAQYRGAGPLALIAMAFGVDPMTGRAAAAAAGHGFFSGWAIAIAGDMLYFWVVMAATLKLGSWLSPGWTVFLIMLAMFLAPLLVSRVKLAWRRRRCSAPPARILPGA
jgi:hypothetical protein